MFRKKEIVYFINKESDILFKFKGLKMIPRKGEIISLKDNKEKYYVTEIVYTLEKNSYICWVYLSEKF